MHLTKISTILWALALLSILGCQPKTVPTVVTTPALLTVPDDYKFQIKAWRTERQQNLLAADSWYSLAGLWWLEPGETTFGGGPDQDITFPGNFPDYMGTYVLENDELIGQAEDLPGLRVEDKKGHKMSYGIHTWNVIERGGRYGIRLKDLGRTASIRIKPLSYFPIDPSYRVAATFYPLVDSSLVMDNRQELPYAVDLVGKLTFTLKGQPYSLPVLDGGPDDLFVIISDETTGGETYGGGRYIYCPRADANNQTILDFNKAFTPPCAFTDFATCLLPGPEHRLPLAVLAGEKAP